MRYQFIKIHIDGRCIPLRRHLLESQDEPTSAFLVKAEGMIQPVVPSSPEIPGEVRNMQKKNEPFGNRVEPFSDGHALETKNQLAIVAPLDGGVIQLPG